VRALAARGWAVAVTGAAHERRLTATVADDHPYVFDLGGRTTFRALAHLLARASAFVGGNTGPAHLAAAVDTPVVSVFPPTVPLERWRPWRVPHVVLGDQTVPCAGCRSQRCPLPEQDCLAPVDTAQITEAVETLAARPLRPPRPGPVTGRAIETETDARLAGREVVKAP
jgi:ADP-heptose:LPS heptosyltransferase